MQLVVVADGVVAIDQKLLATTPAELFTAHDVDHDLAEDSVVEEAVRLKKQVQGSTLTLLSVAPASFERHMRSYLAAGCDRAIRIDADAAGLLDVNARAAAIVGALRSIGAWRLVMMLDRTPGGAPAVLPHLVARRAGVSSASSVASVAIESGDCVATSRREGVIRRYRSADPVVLAMSTRVAPHSPSFMDVHRSRKATIETMTADPQEAAPAVRMLSVREPQAAATKGGATVLSLGTPETVQRLAALCAPFRVDPSSART